MTNPSDRAGVVAIGRNEGERLKLCLDSLTGRGYPVIYVDSGSIDGSVELASSMGATVLALDSSKTFCPARARNEGYLELLRLDPAVQYVQFIDGDCSIAEEWLETAAAFLDANPSYAAVCGRRRERHPEASIYNRLCDMEWNTPVGSAKAFGGDALIRVSAFRQVEGYSPDILAGEDEELCLRLRRAGWKIARIDAEMAVHDAAMMRFSQWWRRAQRAGQAYAQGYALHGRSPDRHFARDCARIVGWGFVLPATAILLSWWTGGLSFLLACFYPLLAVRIYRAKRRKGWDRPASGWYAIFTVLAKFPALVGLVGVYLRPLFGRSQSLIEYKQPVRFS